jgi:hypothetical protein
VGPSRNILGCVARFSRAHIPWWSAECGNNTRSAAIPNKHQTGVDRCLRQALVPSERSKVDKFETV